MPVTAGEDRRTSFPLIEKAKDDHVAVETVSRTGDAVLMPVDEYEEEHDLDRA
ncbi:MAG TPA: type II toxin-antitoxin system prevent-host-death family antitoxin [Cellulomonas sp.]